MVKCSFEGEVTRTSVSGGSHGSSSRPKQDTLFQPLPSWATVSAPGNSLICDADQRDIYRIRQGTLFYPMKDRLWPNASCSRPTLPLRDGTLWYYLHICSLQPVSTFSSVRKLSIASGSTLGLPKLPWWPWCSYPDRYSTFAIPNTYVF